jgi:hypothetical protein
MQIGYYCPLVGEAFLYNLGITPVDLRSVAYNRGAAEFCNSASNKCSLVRRMSGLARDNRALDGIILTNCCHEQEQLVDCLNPLGAVQVFQLNIPRNRSKAAVEFLAEQLEGLVRQLSENSDEPAIFRWQPRLPESEPQPGPGAGLLPVLVAGISVPPWLEGLLKANGLLPLVRDCCGFGGEEDGQPASAAIESLAGYAETVIYRSNCIRSTATAEFPWLGAGLPLPRAALFIALEYCTAASYGFVKVKEFFDSKRIPVFKISIAEWNQPHDKLITQIESIAHVCKEMKDESLY